MYGKAVLRTNRIFSLELPCRKRKGKDWHERHTNSVDWRGDRMQSNCIVTIGLRVWIAAVPAGLKPVCHPISIAPSIWSVGRIRKRSRWVTIGWLWSNTQYQIPPIPNDSSAYRTSPPGLRNPYPFRPSRGPGQGGALASLLLPLPSVWPRSARTAELAPTCRLHRG